MSDWVTRVRPVLLHPDRPLALAAPEFDLPGRPWAGRPGQFIAAVRERLGLAVTLLRVTADRADEAAKVRHTTLEFVVRDGFPADLSWVPTPTPTPATVPGLVPWRYRDWLPGAEAWLVDSLAALGRPVRGPITQVQIAELSCVLRVATDDGQVYFKATADSPLFVNEGPLMAVLADLFPGPVPAPLAVDPVRRWMLLPDVGPEVGWKVPVEVREDVVRAFARLQIASVGMVGRLIAVGCFDRRLDWLAGQADTWLGTVEVSAWLSADETTALRAAGPTLAAACAELAALPVPATLGHGDMHLGNVARTGGDFVFFDWTDACVLHPFVDMITIFNDEDETVRERLRDAYLAEWATFAAPDQLLRAWRLAEPLAALNQAISYMSIMSVLAPGGDPDGLGDEAGDWLRRVLTTCAAATGAR